MQPDHRIEFSSASKTLHWLIALLVLGGFVLGEWMGDAEGRALRQTLLRLHQSNGLLIATLVLIRLAWRLLTVLPEWPASVTPRQRKLLYSVEALLYLGLLAMPLSGLSHALLDDQTISFFGWFEIPNPFATNDLWSGRFEAVHEFGAKALLAAILGHAGLVLYLNWKTSPGFLARMLPSVRRS